MELKLNIYEGKEIVKTYVSQDFELMTGTCEDILRIIDTQKVIELAEKSTGELGSYLLKKAILQYDDFRPLIMKAFAGVTEEEYRNTRMAEVGVIIVSIIMYSVQQVFSILNVPTAGRKKPQKKQEG